MGKESAEMFQLEAEPVSMELEKAFYEWLAKPEARVLRTALAAHCRLAEQEALTQAHASQDTPNSELMSTEAMRRACDLGRCLALLDRFAERELKPITLKLKR